MSLTLYQIASRVDPGTAMQQFRRQRLQAFHDVSRPATSFADQLRQATRPQKAPEPMPVEAGDGTPDIMPVTIEPQSTVGPDMKPESIDQMPVEPETVPLDVLRARYRENYRLGFKMMRERFPELGQGQMGWVMAELSRALSEDPSMMKKDLKQMVKSLVHNAPEYEEAA